MQTPVITEIKTKVVTDKNCRFSSVCCSSSVIVVMLPVYCLLSTFPHSSQLIKSIMLEVVIIFCHKEKKATVNARDQSKLLLDTVLFLVTPILNHPNLKIIHVDSHKNNRLIVT